MARIDFDASRKKFAVYTGGVSDSKLLNPLANLPSIKWHSDLEYIAAVKTLTASVDLSIATFGASLEKALVAHGMPYRPLVLGHITIDGKTVPIQGDFLVAMSAGDVCAYNVYADATHVRIRCEPCQFSTSPRTVVATVVMHICNVGVSSSGSIVRYAPRYAGLDVTRDRLRAGYFDTNNKHFSVSSGGLVMFYKGRSLEIGLGYSLQHNYVYLGFTHNVAGYSCTFASAVAGVEGGFFSGTSTTYQPTIVRTDCL